MNKFFLIPLTFYLGIYCCSPAYLSKKRIEKDLEYEISFNKISSKSKHYLDSMASANGREEITKTLINEGWYYLNKGQPKYAISRFNWVLHLDNLNPNPYWAYGLILLNRCKIDSAESYLTKAFSLDTSIIKLRFDRIYSLAIKTSALENAGIRKRLYDAYIKEYYKFEERFDEAPILYVQFSEILASKGDSMNSVAMLQKAKELNQNTRNAEHILEHIYTGKSLYSYICSEEKRKTKANKSLQHDE